MMICASLAVAVSDIFLHLGTSVVACARLCARWHSILIRPFVIAFLVGACDHRPRLQIFFNQILMAAFWALLSNGFICRCELAFRIVAASIERVPLAGLFFDQIAILAQRTFHADEVLFNVFAFGISAAGSKLAVTTVANHQIAPTFRARLVERNVGNLLALVQTPSSLAIRISGAGHKLT